MKHLHRAAEASGLLSDVRLLAGPDPIDRTDTDVRNDATNRRKLWYCLRCVMVSTGNMNARITRTA